MAPTPAPPAHDRADVEDEGYVPPPSPNLPLKKLAEEAMNAYAEFFPARASFLELRGLHSRLGDYGKSTIDAIVASSKDRLARLEKLQTQGFTDSGRVETEALRVHLRSMIYLLETSAAPMRDPNFYVDESVGALQVFMDRDVAARVMRARFLGERMKRFPEFLATARANLSACPRPAILRALMRLRAARPLFETNLRLAVNRPGDPRESKQEIDTLETAWREVTAFADWLEKERLPGSADAAPLGEKLWREWLRAREDADLPPAVVLAAATDDMTRLQKEFREAAAKLDKTKQPLDVLIGVSRERLEPTFARSEAERILGRFWHFFPDRPVGLPSEEPVVVREAPAFRRRDAPVRAFLPSPFSLVADEVYLEIAAPDPEWPMQTIYAWLDNYGRSFLPLAIAREIYPGRFAAWQYMKRSAIGTCKAAAFPTMTEGWGLYAEETTVRLGFDDNNPKLRIAMLADMIRADGRLIAAVRLHTMGAPKQEVAGWLEREAMWPPSIAAAEAESVLADPDQAAGALGRLAILKLRDDVKRTSKEFSPRTFHESLLTIGAAPVSALRRSMLTVDAGALLAPVKN